MDEIFLNFDDREWILPSMNRAIGFWILIFLSFLFVLEDDLDLPLPLEDFPDYRKGIPTQPPRTKVAAKSRKVSLKDFKFLLGVGLGWTHCY